MVSTRRRCRVLRPWIEKPWSRVFRKFSGELTTIQYWAERPPPDFRLRLDLPGLAGRGCSAAVSCGVSCGVSVTTRRLLAVNRSRRAYGSEVPGLREQRAEVADLRHVAHLVARDQPAHLEQRHLAAVGIADRALPFRLPPAVEQVDGAPPDPREVLERLVQRSRQLEVVAGLDRSPDVGRRAAVEVGVPEEAVDLGAALDEVRD